MNALNSSQRLSHLQQQLAIVSSLVIEIQHSLTLLASMQTSSDTSLALRSLTEMLSHSVLPEMVGHYQLLSFEAQRELRATQNRPTTL